MVADNTNLTLDYYKVKVFLYKYVPQFTRTPDKDVSISNSNNQKIETYSAELDEAKYFVKYDLSDYISSYSFNQSINENTYDWSVIFQDTILTFDQINKMLKVEGGWDWGRNNVNFLSQMEALQGNVAAESVFIADAKISRGSQSKSFDTKLAPASGLLTRIDSTQVTPKGLRLSDLIQPYDMLAVFLYKSKTPLEDLRGTVISTTVTPSGLPYFQVSENNLGLPLSRKNLQTESILLSRIGVSTEEPIREITLFNTELVGYVLEKATSSTAGQVDTITVSGNGMSRLFGTTRRIVKSSLFQESIFKQLEYSGQKNQVSPYHSSFVGMKLHNIIQNLFFDCYRINFDTDESGGLSTSNLNTLNTVEVPTSSYLDIANLKVRNVTTANMFTIPVFLVSLVLKRLGVKYRDVRSQDNVQTIANKAKTVLPVIIKSQAEYQNDAIVEQDILEKQGKTPLQFANSIDVSLSQSGSLLIRRGDVNPVQFSDSLKDLVPYFKFFEQILTDFNPRTKTPYEIIDEIREKTFLEFVELPSGSISIRPPQYNSTKYTVYSDYLDIISTSYGLSSTSLISRQTVKYALDGLETVPGQEFFAYTDGKLILQFGHMEAAAEANPNYLSQKFSQAKASYAESRKAGVIAYAQYLLRLNNAALSTGSITCGYDSSIVVGKTFFDRTNSKFGYITSVSKTVSTGGEATMNITLSYVRDAVIKNNTLQVETLPTLLDISNAYASDVTRIAQEEARAHAEQFIGTSSSDRSPE